ncbi:MAG: molecular chaperone DnaJ, partial [Lachnospiraceae bacterium]|nr:molecular chaperone DnaJ [Lachnospiraceae bacterium]
TASKKRIEVTVPAGIDNGQSIRIPGKGEPGVNGGERGDLLVEVTVSRHPIFKRTETTIYSTVPISFATAALGGTIRIKTVDGEVEYEVKPGTQTDTKVRLRGKGVPMIRNKNVRGDHYVTLVITVPEKLNEEQKEALRRFDEAMNGVSSSEPEGEKKKKKGIFKDLFKDSDEK